MRISFLLFLAVLPAWNLSGQNLIGYNRGEIVKYMKENHKDMNLNSIVNNKFSYLKYSDDSDSETMLFFLENDSVCTGIRIICDEAAKAGRINEFDSTLKKTGNNAWIDSKNGKNYRIELLQDSWSYVFNITSIK
jgi:hypothetical protein